MAHDPPSLVTLLLFVAATACGGDSVGANDPSLSENGTGDETAGESTAEDEPSAGPEELPVAASPCSASGSAPARAPSPFDPATLTGYVSGSRAPDGEGQGRVDTVRLTPHARVPTVSELAFCVSVGGEAREFLVIVPHGFPVPFDEGQEIAYDGGRSGGGPNSRATMIVRDANGALLLSVDHTPPEITVTEGRRVRSEPGSTYREDTHGVVFTPTGGSPLRVGPSTWARLQTPDGNFLVWGDARKRTLRQGAVPPPDYVGGWLDFAIVRMR